MLVGKLQTRHSGWEFCTSVARPLSKFNVESDLNTEYIIAWAATGSFTKSFS